jgi:hypothetical protein|uniref:RING-type domain-containing protein n=1 Tax=viral metagenome TaxID=1070528 RepID=A0A6C0ILE9_9ZZZZ
MKNKTFKKSSKNKKIKLNRQKRTRKTKKRTRRMKGKGPAFSRSRSTPSGPPTADFSVGPHWVKKANVQDDICSLCLESLRNNGRKYVVYELPCGHQFHAYCLHELCDNIENTGVNINGSVSIPCPICRALFNPDHHCHNVLGFTKSDTMFVPEPMMRTLESRDYVFDENDETSGN